MNRTNNNNRHEDGAKAPRESDGHHHVVVYPLDEVAPHDRAVHLGLHFREQDRDKPQRAVSEQYRGDAVRGHIHHHIRLHLPVHDRDEPEPVHIERQPDVNAQ